MARITISNILGGDSFLSSIIGRGSHNDQFTSQPRFVARPFRLDTTEDFVSITGQEQFIYETTPELKIVIDRLAVMFANGVWVEKDKNGEPVEKSIIVDRLENPNIFQSRNEFLFQWFIQRCVYGNVFDYTLKGMMSDVPQAIWHLPPSRMVIKRTGKIFKQTRIEDIIEGYELILDRENNEKYNVDDIIQFSMPNCDDPILGSSPLLALRMPISNIRAAYGFRNVVITRKGALGIWRNETKDATGFVPLSDEDKAMSGQMTRNYGIGDRQASVILSNKNLKWEPSTFPLKDYMLFEEIDADKKAIIDLFGANQDMFSSGSSGGKTGSTFTNREMAERNCYQDTIMPIAQDLANGYAKRFGLLEQGHTLQLDYSHIPTMKDDETKQSDILLKKSQAVQILLQSGVSAEAVTEITGLELGKVKAIQQSTQAPQ